MNYNQYCSLCTKGDIFYVEFTTLRDTIVESKKKMVGYKNKIEELEKISFNAYSTLTSI